MKLEDRLHAFASEHKFFGSKGALSVALVVTRIAARESLPLEPSALKTSRKGQVRGLGGPAVQKILSEHGIKRILAKEGGRTSRGSIDNMQAYVALLNELHKASLVDFQAIEEWWIARVIEFFSKSPLKLKLDPGKSIREALSGVLGEAAARQAESTGTMTLGAVMQHLVGAKLSVLFPEENIESHGFSVADAPTARAGDFGINGYVIHVTARPTEALVNLCEDNLSGGLMPMVVTSAEGVVSMDSLSKGTNAATRIEVLDIEHFLVTNIAEWSGFRCNERKSSIGRLIEEYNRIVDQAETDPSLRIEVV